MENPLPSLAQLLVSSEVRAALDGLPSGLDDLAVGEKLRRNLPASLAREAAVLVALRRRAQRKLPEAARLLLTEKGLEQATAWPVAQERARRFARHAGIGIVVDATAGIGGDALALAAAGLNPVAGDRDPVTASFLAANLRAVGAAARVVIADAEHLPLRPDLLLLDPDRRPEAAPGTSPGVARGPRRGDPERWRPRWSRCRELVAKARGACIKMAPGTDLERLALPPDLPCSWQWVSLGGELRELAMWTGVLAESAGEAGKSGLREVLALDGRGGRGDLVGEPEEVAALETEDAAAVSWLAEPDPALIRSGLLGLAARREGLAPLGPGIAYVGGDHRPKSPLFRAFSVIASAPLDPRRVRTMLAEHGVGPLTVKRRGHPDDAATLQRRFRGKGKKRGLLVVTRLAQGHRAYLVHAIPPPSAE